MTATPSDFIAAGDFALRDNVPIGTSSLSFTGSSSKLGAPGTLQVGQRVKLDDGTHTDYYRLLDARTPKLLGGLYEWIDVGVAPHGVRAYTAASTTVTFVPFAAARANFPAVSVKQHERTSLTLTDFFEMIGGRDADLTYIAKPGGAEAKFAVSGRALTILGHKPGKVTATITAYDKAQGTVVQTISVTVLPANRAPVSTRALGDPTVGVGATKAYDLATYFEDPDSDVLSWVVNGENSHVSASFSGDVMTLAALSQGDATLSVVATDPAGLHTSQQMQVLVPRNRRPARTRHVPAQALEVGGPARTVDLAQSFSDPDGGALGWLFQYEQGDPAHQYRQEVWFVASQTGSNLLALESHFAYPPGSDAPWGAGSAWTVPAGTGYVLRTARGTDPAITRTSGTLLSAATATWDATARKVNLSIRTASSLALTPLAAPSRLLLGVDLDVAWAEGSSGAGEGLQLNLLPGDSPGRRAGYVEVYDTRGQIASDIFAVSLGRAPVLSVAAIPDQTLIAGSDVTIDLDTYFSDPDGDEITYKVSGAPASVVALSLRHKIVVTPDALARDSVLHIHGVTAARAVVTVTASDPDGLHLSTTFDADVTASAVAAPPALLPPASIDRIDRLLTGEAIEAVLTRVTSTTAVPFPSGVWYPISQDWIYIAGGSPASYRDTDDNDEMRFFSIPEGQVVVGVGGQAGTTLDSRIQVGDRFQAVGNNAVFEIAELIGPWNTPGDQASGLILYNDRVIQDVRLTENPQVTTSTPGWFWDATADTIAWLPRLTSVGRHISFPVVPLSGTPIEVDSPSDYLSAFTAICPWDGLIAAISPELPLAFLAEGAEFSISSTGSPVTYRIEKRLARYYRHRPVAVEMTLTALPDTT